MMCARVVMQLRAVFRIRIFGGNDWTPNIIPIDDFATTDGDSSSSDGEVLTLADTRKFDSKTTEVGGNGKTNSARSRQQMIDALLDLQCDEDSHNHNVSNKATSNRIKRDPLFEKVTFRWLFKQANLIIFTCLGIGICMHVPKAGKDCPI